MVKLIAITPKKCIGCTNCALTCSITYNDSFDLSKAHVSIKKQDIKGIFKITFSSTCKNCLKCTEVCPTGALKTVVIPEETTA